MLTPDEVKELRKPFPASWHEFIRGYTYVQEWAICDRLDNVDPSWSFNITNIDRRDEIVTVTATMTVNGVTRENTGSQTIQYVTEGDRNSKKWKRDEDGNKIEIGEPEKGATTDALKRCARLFGIGRYLLTLPDSVKDERGLDQWLQAKLARQQDTEDTTEPPPGVDPDTGEITAPKVTADKAKQTLNGSKTRKMETRGEVVLASIGLKARDDGNPFLTVEVEGKKYFSFTRQPFRDADILCDHWDEPGKTYSFPSARVEWEENNSGQRIITTVEKLPELAKASGE